MSAIMESGEAESVAPPSVCQQLLVVRKLDNARQLRGMFDASSNALQNTDKLPRRSPPQYLGNARQNTLVLLMPTKARDQGQRELDTNLIKITSLQEG